MESTLIMRHLVSLQESLLGDELQKKPVIPVFMSGTENCGKMITGFHGHLNTNIHTGTLSRHTQTSLRQPCCITTVYSLCEVTAISLIFVPHKRKKEKKMTSCLFTHGPEEKNRGGDVKGTN